MNCCCLLFLIRSSEGTLCSSIRGSERRGGHSVRCDMSRRRASRSVACNWCRAALFWTASSWFPKAAVLKCPPAIASTAQPTWPVAGAQQRPGGFPERTRPPTAWRSGAAQCTTTRRRSRSLPTRALCVFSVHLPRRSSLSRSCALWSEWHNTISSSSDSLSLHSLVFSVAPRGIQLKTSKNVSVSKWSRWTSSSSRTSPRGSSARRLAIRHPAFAGTASSLRRMPLSSRLVRAASVSFSTTSPVWRSEGPFRV